MNKLTYKHFNIGEKVTCVKNSTDDNKNNDSDFWEQHLTIGKVYIIEDTDFHFPDAICVRSDNKKISMFMPIELFSDVKKLRKEKYIKIKNDNKR